jgi:hypothetical protein
LGSKTRDNTIGPLFSHGLNKLCFGFWNSYLHVIFYLLTLTIFWNSYFHSLAFFVISFFYKERHIHILKAN